MPDSNGPGRNRATSAIMSSRLSGCRRRTKSFIPRDSNWKTAVVRADFNNLKDAGSSKGMRLISMGGSLFLARCLLDRKSTRLNSSHVRISYAVFCLKKKKKKKKKHH